MLTIGVCARRALCRLAPPLERPGPRCSKVRGRLARHPPIAVRRPGGRALEQGQHRAHARLAVERRHHLHLAGAGIGEADIDARIRQRLQNCFCAVHGSSSLKPQRRRTRVNSISERGADP